jgi:hypothetical protein
LESPQPKEGAVSESLFELAIKELEERKEDIRPSDVVLLSEPLRSALNFVIRLGRFNLTEFTEKLGFSREETKRIADLLVKRNLFEVAKYSTEQETYYEARLSATTRPLMRPPSDLWKKID